MNKTAIIGVTMVMLLACNLSVRADDCEIANGSFENDGWINDILAEEPNGWNVSALSQWFDGRVNQEWVTEGSFNLELFSARYQTYNANDTILLSQQLELTDVNNITFDVYLDTYPVIKVWNPAECTAVFMIDEDVVWESNSVGDDARGPYPDQVYDVNDKYRDGQLHTISLGIRINVGAKLNTAYITQWDFLRCSYFCESGGFPYGDLNFDCSVDMKDLGVVADLWLGLVDPEDAVNMSVEGDLAGYGIINFMDFALIAGDWDGSLSSIDRFAEKWLEDVESDDIDNLFHEDDVDPNGVINFFDYAVFIKALMDDGN